MGEGHFQRLDQAHFQPALRPRVAGTPPQVSFPCLEASNGERRQTIGARVLVQVL
jgi:hypothetical protein